MIENKICLGNQTKHDNFKRQISFFKFVAGVFITKDDFQMALKVVQPSSKREGFVTVPDVKWEDIGSLQDIRQELQMAILVSQTTWL